MLLENEDSVIILDDGKKICPHCLAGEIKILGGPIKVGITGAWDPNVTWLCRCDVCDCHYNLRDEEYRLSVVERHGVVAPVQN